MPTDAELIDGVRAAGNYDAEVVSLADALRIVRQALPHAVELPEALLGLPYPPPGNAKAWYQVHPAEPSVGNDRPHVKYADWTHGKKRTGGSWGHLFFPPA